MIYRPDTDECDEYQWDLRPNWGPFTKDHSSACQIMNYQPLFDIFKLDFHLPNLVHFDA